MGYKGENTCMSNELDGFKMASYPFVVPLNRDGFLIANLIRTNLCGAKIGKKICYRILDYREMTVEVLEVTIT